MLESQKTVLIVDDDISILKLLRLVLEEKGYEVIDTALDGQIAIDLYKSYPIKPDVVLMDYNMPVKDGIKATKEILELDKNARIIIISGIIRIKELALESGAVDFVIKPFSIQNLLKNMNKLVKFQISKF